MSYRIHRRDAVVSGKWYHVVKCKGCSKNIYILDDIHDGKGSVKFTGEGILSIPCHECFHDDFYAVDCITTCEAPESRKATYPDREKVSPSDRKPLKKAYPNSKVTMGVGFIEDRPKAAMLVGRIVTSWADIEVLYTRLLGELMQTTIPTVSAVFATLRTSQAQSSAITAAAEVVLDTNDLILLQAYNNRKDILAKTRNDLAHGCFGVSVSIPEHIVWISQADLLALNAEYVATAGQEDLDLSSKQFVYEIGTLERIAQEIIEFHSQLVSFIGYLSARSRGKEGNDFRQKRYLELCEQPKIKPALESIKRNKRNKRNK